jgi:hypothetical protein
MMADRNEILKQKAVDTVGHIKRALDDKAEGGLRGQFKGLVEDVMGKRGSGVAKILLSVRARVEAVEATLAEEGVTVKAVRSAVSTLGPRVAALERDNGPEAVKRVLEVAEMAFGTLGKRMVAVAKNVALLTGDVVELQRENASLKDELAKTTAALAEVRTQLADVTALTKLAFGEHGEYAEQSGMDQSNSHAVRLLEYIATAYGADGSNFNDNFALPATLNNPTAGFNALNALTSNLDHIVKIQNEERIVGADPDFNLDQEVAHLSSIVSACTTAVNDRLTRYLFEYVVDAMLESDPNITARKLSTLQPDHLSYAKGVITNPDNKAYVSGVIAKVCATSDQGDINDTYDSIVSGINGGS